MVEICIYIFLHLQPATHYLLFLLLFRQHSSNDETGSSSGSAEHIYQPPRGRRTRGRTAAGTRPATSKLERPSVSDMDIPNIRLDPLCIK